MEKYIQNNLKTEIKQLINMQHLLTEYDRQNKFLNRQVLQLLEENKNLKLDRIKNNYLLQSNGKKQNRPSDRLYRKNSNNLIKKQRQKTQIQPFEDFKKNMLKKDEAIQVEEAPPCQANKIVSSKLNNIKTQVQAVPALKGKQIIKVQSQTNQIIQHSFELQHKQRLNTVKNIRTADDQMGKTLCTKPSTQIANISSKQTEDKQIQFSQLDPSFQDISKRRQIHQINRKQNRSNHAIEPSPKITPASSEKKLNVQPETSEKYSPLKRVSTFISKKNESQQKKRRFLLIISKRESVSKSKIGTQKQGCC